MIVRIAGIDRTSLIEAGSVTIVQTLGGRATADLELFDPTDAVKPQVGQSIMIEHGADKLFAGSIESVTRQLWPQTMYWFHRLSCVDHHRILDRRLTGEREWANVNAGTIVADICNTNLTDEGVDITNVSAGPLIEKFALNYATVAEAIDQVAQLAQMHWSIDADKRLWFFTPGAIACPVTFSSPCLNAEQIGETSSREGYANKLVLRLGSYVRAEQTARFTNLGRMAEDGEWADPAQALDGARRVFQTSYPIASEPRIAVDGIWKSIGIDGVDAGKEWYWNKGSNAVRQDDAQPPLQSTQTLYVIYQGQDSAFVAAQNNDEIDLRATLEGHSGIYEAVRDAGREVQAADAQQLVQSILDQIDSHSRTLSIATNSIIEPQCTAVTPGQTLSFGVFGYTTGQYLVRQVRWSPSAKVGEVDCVIEAVSGPILGDAVSFFREMAGQTGVVPSAGLPPPAAAGESPEASQPGSGDWSIGTLLSRTTDQAGVQWCGIPITVTIPADADYAQVWGYRGTAPPASPSLYRVMATIPQGSGPQSEMIWVEKESAAYTLYLVVTASTSQVTTFPSAATPYKTVTVPALSLAGSLTGSYTEAVPYIIGGAQHYRLRFNGSYDTADPNLQYIVARWRFTDSSFSNPGEWITIWYGAPGKEFPNASPFSAFQPDPPWPIFPDVSQHYVQIELGAQNWAGEINWSGALSNLYIGGDNKVDATAMRNLASVAGVFSNRDYEHGSLDWILYGNSAIVSGAGLDNSNALRITANGGINWAERFFSARPGQKFATSVWARKSANGTGYVQIAFFNSSYVWLGYEQTVYVTSASWTKYDIVSQVAPANTAYVRVAAALNTDANNGGTMDVDAWSDLSISVPDGFIDGSQLANQTVTAAQIAERTLTAQKIALEAITTAEIAASIDPPIYSVTPPGSTYLGRRYATYSGQLYEWTGSVYRRVVNSSAIKSELTLDKLTSDQLAANSATFGIVAAGAIGADQMRAVEFILKADGSRPPRWIVRNTANSDVAMIGNYGGEDGLWAINGRFGGTWYSPAAHFSSSAAALNGVEFTLVKNGITTKIKNDNVWPGTYGMTIEDLGFRGSVSQHGLYIDQIVGVFQASVAVFGKGGIFLAPDPTYFPNQTVLKVLSVPPFSISHMGPTELYESCTSFGPMIIDGASLQLKSSQLTRYSGGFDYVVIDTSGNIGHSVVYNSDTGVVDGISLYRNLSIPYDVPPGASLSDVINSLNQLFMALRATPPITDITYSTVQRWIPGYTAGTYGVNYQGKIPLT